MRTRLVSVTAILSHSILGLALRVNAQTPPVPVVAATVSPGYVVINTPAQVTFTADLSALESSPTRVNLLTTNAAGSQILGTAPLLHDDGMNGDAVVGDKVFSYLVRVSSQTSGVLYYRVAVSLPGVSSRVLSSVMRVPVVSLDTSASATFSENGGSLSDGTTQLSVPSNSLSRGVIFTVSTRSRNSLPPAIPADAPVYGAVDITAHAEDGHDEIPADTGSYAALVTTPLFSSRPPGSLLAVMAPTDLGTDWRVTQERATVDPSGWFASFRTNDVGLILLVAQNNH